MIKKILKILGILVLLLIILVLGFFWRDAVSDKYDVSIDRTQMYISGYDIRKWIGDQKFSGEELTYIIKKLSINQDIDGSIVHSKLNYDDLLMEFDVTISFDCKLYNFKICYNIYNLTISSIEISVDEVQIIIKDLSKRLNYTLFYITTVKDLKNLNTDSSRFYFCLLDFVKHLEDIQSYD